MLWFTLTAFINFISGFQVETKAELEVEWWMTLSSAGQGHNSN